ncbi:ferredoxin [Rhodococcus sp. NPDC003322]
MRIRLDRTVCDGFGICARHAPQYFSLDDWGYATLIGDGSVPPEDHDAAMRALLDCPAHAIIEMTGEYPAPTTGRFSGRLEAQPPDAPSGNR